MTYFYAFAVASQDDLFLSCSTSNPEKGEHLCMYKEGQ